MLTMSHSKAQLSLGGNCAKLDIVFHCTILNMKMFDIASKCFQIKIKKNGYNISLIIVILLNAISGD